MIPQPLTLSIPLVATTLIAWLIDDKLPQWANYVIIISFFVASVALSVFASGSLTGDPSKDFYIIVGICFAIFAALKDATNTASTKLPSPLGALAAKATKNAELQREVEAMWAAARPNVPPRASTGVVDGTGQAMPSQPGIDTTPTPAVPPAQPQ